MQSGPNFFTERQIVSYGMTCWVEHHSFDNTQAKRKSIIQPTLGPGPEVTSNCAYGGPWFVHVAAVHIPRELVRNLYLIFVGRG
ncbi:hypothetical protein FHW20_004097 [Ochrobactrum intermedium]|uniref:Uncharacterized protein n=1 Tax=Brucella intermedia TaxID=94625 RepID=A0ABR6AUG2_9HYPH|nr:hypothetical protein [Brucella intermedia]NYD84185.1 hypothetical protein [Brucella intermedia]